MTQSSRPARCEQYKVGSFHYCLRSFHISTRLALRYNHLTTISRRGAAPMITLRPLTANISHQHSTSNKQQATSKVYHPPVSKPDMPRSRSASPNAPTIDSKTADMDKSKRAATDPEALAKSAPQPKPPTRRKTSGTYIDCGRHSSDWYA